MIGVSPNEIRHKLGEHYTFNDIDEICESLKTYKLNIGSLPYEVFRESKSNNSQTSLNESVKPKAPTSIEDSVDDMLMQLVNKD